MSKSIKAYMAITTALAFTCFGCNPSTPSNEGNSANNAQQMASSPVAQVTANAFGLVPFADVQAPEITKSVKVKMVTDAGDMVIEVYPEAAPNASQRFLELVSKGFYDNTPIFRVVNIPQPFVAQFGINWRPGMVEYKENCFKDDPSYFQLLPGTLAFAKAGPDTNSTQVFINYADNSPLRVQGFTTFARIVEGYEVSQKFQSVGSPEMGLDQGKLWTNGDKYLESLDRKPNMIIKAELIGSDGKQSENKAPEAQSTTK